MRGTPEIVEADGIPSVSESAKGSNRWKLSIGEKIALAAVGLYALLRIGSAAPMYGECIDQPSVSPNSAWLSSNPNPNLYDFELLRDINRRVVRGALRDDIDSLVSRERKRLLEDTPKGDNSVIIEVRNEPSVFDSGSVRFEKTISVKGKSEDPLIYAYFGYSKNDGGKVDFDHEALYIDTNSEGRLNLLPSEGRAFVVQDYNVQKNSLVFPPFWWKGVNNTKQPYYKRDEDKGFRILPSCQDRTDKRFIKSSVSLVDSLYDYSANGVAVRLVYSNTGFNVFQLPGYLPDMSK